MSVDNRMMSNQKMYFVRKKEVFYFFAFVLPYIIITFIDSVVIGKRWYFAGTDSLQSYTGAGWAYSHFQPLLFGHPGSFLHMLTGGLIHVAGGIDNIGLVNQLGLGVNVLMVLISGILSALIANHIKLPVYILLLVSLGVCLMPAGLHYLMIWGPYFFYSILCVPIGFGMYAISRGKSIEYWPIAASFFILGFLVGVLYFGANSIVAFGITILLFRRKINWVSIGEPLAFENPSMIYRRIVDVIFIMFITLALLASTDSNIPFYDTIPVTKRTPLNTVIGIVGCCLIIRFILQRFSHLRGLYYGAGGLMLIGWLASVSLVAPLWAKGAFIAFKRKGSAAIEASFFDSLDLIDLISFLQQRSWHWMIVFGLVIALIALWQGHHKNTETERGAFFCGLFIFLSIILSAVVSWDISLIGRIETKEDFGQVSTYYLPVIPALIIAICYLHQLPMKGRVGLTIVFLGVVGFSSVDYFQAVNGTTQKYMRSVEKMASTIDKFLIENPNGQVLCFRTLIPRRCSHLYVANYIGNPRYSNLRRSVSGDGNFFYMISTFREECGPENAHPCPDPLLYLNRPKLLIMWKDYFLNGKVLYRDTYLQSTLKTFRGSLSDLVMSKQ